MGVEEVKEDIQQEPKPLEMIIRMIPGGSFSVSFSLMPDKVSTYGFLKLAEKTLDKHYEEAEKKHIEPVKGGLINFARNRLGGKI